jgi:hypothetical protein
MKNINKLTIIIVVLNLLIVIAAGHGFGILGLIELFWFPYNVSKYDIQTSLDSYDKSLPFVALLSLIGQIVLLISLLNSKFQLALKIIGNILLLLAFYLLSKDLRDDEKSCLSFLTGLPFLITSIGLFILMVNEKSKTKCD